MQHLLRKPVTLLKKPGVTDFTLKHRMVEFWGS